MVACLLSCTKYVWENRQDCPCTLTLDLKNIPPGIDTLHVWMFGEDNEILYRDTIGSEYFGRDYEVLIKRNIVRCFIWGNIREATILNDNLTLNTSLIKQKNISADSLYFYKTELNTSGEHCRDVVNLKKDFSTVDVTLKSQPSGTDQIQIELFSGTAGRYVDGRFLAGNGNIISTSFLQEGNTMFSYRIIRQANLLDVTMALIVLRGDNIPLMEKFPLGKWLQENGYDMTAENLSDIRIEFDLSLNFVQISVDDWQVTFPTDIEF